ncbi:dihydrolipoamide acetyltransferase family protein [Halalkalibacterium ligniniphilum]|uniref:dihydrolipoamide acetyltransferase family protein n=1 Tax=Halalkalibacterium ligniniphilum TaxID=1134413 RepID=UPI0003486B75|nr:dihydrolipoamide acetyltransferase family protein [Halalkalibacterium ligniniphilum]
MLEFKLPDVGEGMHEGEILTWLISEGDKVTQDQPVVEVQTDKVNAELTAPVDGIIQKIFFSEGEIVEVGTTIFTIIEEGATERFSETEESTEKHEEGKSRGLIPIDSSIMETRRALATPFVRQMARKMNIDLEKVRGTGAAGRITEQDLQQFSQDGKEHSMQTSIKTAPTNVAEKNEEKQAVQPRSEGIIQETEERIPLKGIRKKIAEQMTKSVSTIPHVTHVDELEMGPLKEIRGQLKAHAEKKNIKLTFLPFFIKAIVTALKEFKSLNASIDDEKKEIILKQYYHIGIATDTNDGLIVPVIKYADQKSIFQLAEEISQLASQAREGKLSVSQLTGSTFTISNVGPIGGQHATPIINHPEVAILALHKMEPRMVVRDWEGVIRLMMNISLSFDHRIIDGVTAVRFTNRIIELLESPNLLFMEMN